MKRSPLSAVLTALVFSALSACGGGGGGSSVLFADDFDDPAVAGAGPWAGGATLPNGWVSATPTEQRWWVATSGGAGATEDHALVANNVGDTLLHPIAAQDYTVSANVKYRAFSGDIYPTSGQTHGAWLLGRAENSYHFSCRLEYDGTGDTTYLRLNRWTEANGNTELIQAFFTGPIELGVYYHLSLRLDGDTVTCRASSATHPEVSTSMVDDGSMGPKLTGTNAGLRFNGAVSFHPYFDDFRVEGL